jgi:hypothetical protein
VKWTACLLIAVVACKGSDKDGAKAGEMPPPLPPISAPRDAAVSAPPAVADAAVAAVPTRPQPPDLIQGADAMYPTARKAGTADLFFLEDPVRGPHVTRVRKPSKSGLRMTTHGNCTITGGGLACSAAGPSSGDRTQVRVWRRRADGQPVLAEWRIAGRVDDSAVLAYDAAGALTQLARFDEVGDISYVRTYDPPGKRYTARNLDGSNNLDGCGAMDLAFDAGGRVAGETCLQWLGDPMRDTNGVTTSKYVRDDAGFITREERFDPAGAPMAGVRDAVHRIDTERDALGRNTIERYYDVAGQPTPSAEERGCYGIARDHEKGQEVRRRCLGADGLPRRDTDGVATFETERDDKGCQIGVRHLGARGELVQRDGVARFTYKVDRHCYQVASSCFDRNDQLVACGAGEPAGFIHKRDRHGRIVSSKFIDRYGEESVDADYDVHEVRYAFDPLGRQYGESCHDQDGRLVECASTGFARTHDKFDDHGRISERRFFDADNQPATNRGTIARQYVYDNYDHLAETRNLDESGQLFESDGMAIKRNYYDDTHLLFGIALLDRNEQPAEYSACFTGVDCPPGNQTWHAVRIVRSPDGRATYNHYFDAQGRKILTLDCKTDECWGVD